MRFLMWKPAAWYAPYVGGAWRAGLVNGVADGVFGVGQNITRQDMAVMTWRAAEAAGLRLGEKAERKNFADQAEIADYALRLYPPCKRRGLFSG